MKFSELLCKIKTIKNKEHYIPTFLEKELAIQPSIFPWRAPGIV